jgi:hypothetical protein
MRRARLAAGVMRIEAVSSRQLRATEEMFAGLMSRCSSPIGWAAASTTVPPAYSDDDGNSAGSPRLDLDQYDRDWEHHHADLVFVRD